MIVPKRPKDTPHAVRELAALDPALDVREPAVLWLDDIDAYLFAGDLEVVTLDRLRAAMPDLLLLGTIRKGKLADLRALERKGQGGKHEPLAKAIGDVLDLSHRIKPDAELEPEESQVAEKYYPDQDLRKGIGARLIDAPRLLDRLQTARAYCPEGGAVAHAAIDWRRTGVLRRPTEADLEALYSAYLEEDFPVSAENFSRGGQPSGLFTGPRGRFWASWAVPLRRRIAG